MNKVLVTGGMGYVGSLLVPKLLDLGYQVNVLDLGIFGNNLPKNKALKVFQGDIRDTKLRRHALKGVDSVIHLAGLANDASSEVNKEFTKSINYEASCNLIDDAEKIGVKKFIFASSASVYGIKSEKDVTEMLSVNPITLYGELKAKVEQYLAQKDKLNWTVLRPATLCGPSPRLRLDLSVNVLTYKGYFDKDITVFGGSQMRPNLHVQDMVRAYVTVLESDDFISNHKVYNVSTKNYSILELAQLAQKELDNHAKISITPTNDLRSYRLNSEKIRTELNFQTKYDIKDAIKMLIAGFEKGIYHNTEDDKYRNVKLVKKLYEEGKF